MTTRAAKAAGPTPFGVVELDAVASGDGSGVTAVAGVGDGVASAAIGTEAATDGVGVDPGVALGGAVGVGRGVATAFGVAFGVAVGFAGAAAAFTGIGWIDTHRPSHAIRTPA
jgi:hypothetical protein